MSTHACSASLPLPQTIEQADRVTEFSRIGSRRQGVDATNPNASEKLELRQGVTLNQDSR